ncbi:MAG: hypothetical protein GXX85_11390 [Ignavibacteria bacterium]|nr:hypothetical protein [Ignavibacteria bacterium]
MKIFEYSFPAKLILKYSFIPLSVIMIIYIFYSLGGLLNSWFFIFPLIIHLLLFYIIIRFYVKIKEYFPFKIEINSEKIVCENFLGKKDNVEIKFTEIEDISGGIFNGNYSRPIYITAADGKIKIGIYRHLKNYNELLKIILSSVSKELYNDLLKKMEKSAGFSKSKNKKAL